MTNKKTPYTVRTNTAQGGTKFVSYTIVGKDRDLSIFLDETQAQEWCDFLNANVNQTLL
ncbi:MAG: hypothetical protein F6K62_09940 [Sphaerospermopsis sp. SIO1G2]|nr:hypothetical protein [Sphaerospermopsis sp. SIO1G2]